MKKRFFYEECIICWKYNDFFYSISNSSVHENASRLVIVICSEKEKFTIPIEKYSNTILFFEYNIKSILSLIKVLLEVFLKLKYINVNKVYISNPILIINQFIIKVLKSKDVILVEDGIMNYYNFIPNTSKMKRIMQSILGISNQKTFTFINKTLLLAPNKAVFYYGRKAKLNIKEFDISGELLRRVENKNILIGTPFYKQGRISVEDYSKLLNYIVEKYRIDLYLPHLTADKSENVNIPILNMGDYNCTFEILASKANFSIFSFGSSVSYTTKLINPNISSCIFETEYYKISDVDLLKETVDRIIKIQNHAI